MDLDKKISEIKSAVTQLTIQPTSQVNQLSTSYTPLHSTINLACVQKDNNTGSQQTGQVASYPMGLQTTQPSIRQATRKPATNQLACQTDNGRGTRQRVGKASWATGPDREGVGYAGKWVSDAAAHSCTAPITGSKQVTRAQNFLFFFPFLM